MGLDLDKVPSETASAVRIGAPGLCEAGSEGIDNAADAIAKLHQRFEQRLTLDNPRLVERYLKSELTLLLFFNFVGSGDYVAGFQRSFVGGLQEEGKRGHFGPIGHQSVHVAGDFCSHVHAAKFRECGENNAVFVDIVKPMEGPEIGSIASLVWFERADRIDSVLSHSLYFSRKSGFKLFGRLSDEKAGFVPKIAASGADQIELLGKVIEGATKVVENVPGDHADGRRDGANPNEIMNQLSRIRIGLDANIVWIGFEKGSDLSIEVSDVFIGPFNF
jgi:hypothetical protein